jgi:5-(carboxyamino)imidazole ribonucleotide synthase
VLEQMLTLDYEVSVVLARDENGAVKCFPTVENQHTNGILDVSIAPARASACQRDAAQEYAERIAERLGFIGTLAVEFFVSRGELVVNEMAPRPTTAATTPSTPASPASTSSRCAPCAACRWASAPAQRLGDGQSARRAVVRRRRAPRPLPRARLVAAARRARPAPAPLRQAPRPPWPQDGPLHGDRRDAADVLAKALAARAAIGIRDE